jgi:hypothetical protein
MTEETLLKLKNVSKEWQDYSLEQKKDQILKIKLKKEDLDLYVEIADFFFTNLKLVEIVKELKAYI